MGSGARPAAGSASTSRNQHSAMQAGLCSSCTNFRAACADLRYDIRQASSQACRRGSLAKVPGDAEALGVFITVPGAISLANISGLGMPKIDLSSHKGNGRRAAKLPLASFPFRTALCASLKSRKCTPTMTDGGAALFPRSLACFGRTIILIRLHVSLLQSST